MGQLNGQTKNPVPLKRDNATGHVSRETLFVADRDTIAAIATAPGRAGIGVVRVSGHDLSGLSKTICGKFPLPRTAMLCDFADGVGGVIDQGLALYFPAPQSYT